MSGVLSRLSRNERRHFLAKEATARKTGAWGAWELHTFPRGTAGQSWASDFTQVKKNNVFSVLIRTVIGKDGMEYGHLAITSLSGVRPTWPEAQRIKNELYGESSTCVEIYPPQSEVIDEANMYHLWLIPGDLPFSLRSRS